MISVNWQPDDDRVSNLQWHSTERQTHATTANITQHVLSGDPAHGLCGRRIRVVARGL